MALKPSVCPEVEFMDESLETIFLTIIRQNDIAEAVDFLLSIDTQFIPGKKVLREILFNILMTCENQKTLAKTYAYLLNILKRFPPTTDERHKFYQDFIRYSYGIQVDLWNVICDIVNSYLIYHEVFFINKDEKGQNDCIKYPNCKFLLEFFIKLFNVDFEYCSKSGTTSLFTNLLWPVGDINSSSNRVVSLFKWINEIYQSPVIEGELLKVNELITLMVKCIVSKHNLTNMSAFNNSNVIKMAEDITNFCPVAYHKLPSLKVFLTSFEFKCLRARVCEKLIKNVLNATKPNFAETLKDIISMYIYPNKLKQQKALKTVVNKPKLPRKKSVDRKLEPTILHELCKNNKFFNLVESLSSHGNLINSQDQNGSTPLHEACQMKNYMCVKMLIQESGKGNVPKLDYMLPNNNGATALHLAVKENSLEIVRYLLEAGGSSLLNALDCKGRSPLQLASNQEMRRLLMSFQTTANKPDKSVDKFEPENPFTDSSHEAPVLKSYQDYSIYLHALNCLLCSYCDIFNLYNIKQTIPQDHKLKKCYHFSSTDTCSEDIGYRKELPNIIENFSSSLLKNALKTNFQIDIEIIPLRAFAASLK